MQLDAQAAVTSGGPYKNHGQLMKTATHVVSPAEVDGDITEECSSCIINQFARKIPIGTQKACGPDPEPELCEEGGLGLDQVTYGAVYTFNSIQPSPQACCQACVANLSCLQWLQVGSSCLFNTAPTCVGTAIFRPIPSGNIRCR